jgi:hypothetical protein
MIARALTVVALLIATSGATLADQQPQWIAAGTRLKFHLDAPASSSESRTGQTFAFALLAPIVLDGSTIPVDGSTGLGTIVLAGHAGPNGHEGDLTLRIDSLRTADGRIVTFADQNFEINGKNYKIATGVLGFVPFVGIGAHIIRGNEITVDPSTPIETVLLHPATIAYPPTPQRSAASS